MLRSDMNNEKSPACITSTALTMKSLLLFLDNRT